MAILHYLVSMPVSTINFYPDFFRGEVDITLETMYFLTIKDIIEEILELCIESQLE